MKLDYKTILYKDIEKFQKPLERFFFSLYNKNYAPAINNSSFICVCLESDKIVGAGRVITDFSRFAFIVDLNVKKAYRRQGIGMQLMKNITNMCLFYRIKYIKLNTDPRSPWLEKYYAKLGFAKDEDSIHMDYRR